MSFHGGLIDSDEAVKVMGDRAKCIFRDICFRGSLVYPPGQAVLGDQKQNAAKAKEFYDLYVSTNGAYGWSVSDLRQTVFKGYISAAQFEEITNYKMW